METTVSNLRDEKEEMYRELKMLRKEKKLDNGWVDN